MMTPKTDLSDAFFHLGEALSAADFLSDDHECYRDGEAVRIVLNAEDAKALAVYIDAAEQASMDLQDFLHNNQPNQ